MKTGATLIVAYVVLILAGLVGYILNLISVISGFLHDAPITTLFIGRIIGLFAFPVGGVLGYF